MQAQQYQLHRRLSVRYPIGGIALVESRNHSTDLNIVIRVGHRTGINPARFAFNAESIGVSGSTLGLTCNPRASKNSNCPFEVLRTRAISEACSDLPFSRRITAGFCPGFSR